jgi:hypothetical protein
VLMPIAQAAIIVFFSTVFLQVHRAVSPFVTGVTGHECER